ncbi:MAG: sulfotransferase [Rhodobacteraceae bacterium]|nr:sulfotransferase [Paracoccaceae bacterium]
MYAWLRTHPDVFRPAVKEPGYFAYAGGSAVPAAGPYDPEYVRHIVVERGPYTDLYEAAGPRLTGDVSPVYLLDENAAARIAAVRPDARIIVLLRDPVERAFSQFLHHVRDSLETGGTFEEGLKMEPRRLRDGWSWGFGYAAHGHYAAQIERYLAVFPRDQILFLDHGDLQTAPGDCWRRISTHLGLEHRSLERNDRGNATAGLTHVSRRPLLSHRLRHPGAVQTRLKSMVPPAMRSRLRQALEGGGRPVPVLRAETRQVLAGRYRGERSRIEAQTGLTLRHWFA